MFCHPLPRRLISILRAGVLAAVGLGTVAAVAQKEAVEKSAPGADQAPAADEPEPKAAPPRRDPLALPVGDPFGIRPKEPEPLHPALEPPLEPEPAIESPRGAGGAALQPLPAPGAVLRVVRQVFTWKTGEAPVKMIHQAEGFCFLTSIRGKLSADTDQVRVHVGEDGYWYLDGKAESNLEATAMAVRFTRPGAAAATAEPAPEEPRPVDVDVSDLTGVPKILRLPAPADRIVVGGGGKFLIMALGKLRKLAILDTEQGKIVKYLSIGDDTLFAAGARHLIVIRAGQQIIQRYNLKGFERELSVTLDVGGTPTGAVMGASSDGPLLLAYGRGRPDFDQAFALIDVATLRPGKYTFQGDSYGFDGSQMWASADGSTFGCQRSGGSPSGLTVLVLEGNRGEFRYEHDSAGYVMPSADGRIIFTAAGLFNADLQPLGGDVRDRFAGYYLPSIHPGYYLGLSDREGKFTISVYGTTDRQKLVALPALPELKTDRDHFEFYEGLPIYQRLWFLPAQKRIITLGKTQDTLYLRRFDLMEMLRKADVDYLFVSSLPIRTARKGRPYEYQLQVESRRGQVRCKLESGPEGMQLSGDGKLTWTPPNDLRDPEVGVIVSVGDASGQEVFHSFMIRLPENARPPKQDDDRY